MLVKHSVLMTVEEYFAIKNYLVQLKAQGKFDNDEFMQKFYKAFAIESSIKLDRKHSLFDNADAHVEFFLENNHTMLSTVGLFCREHSIDKHRIDPLLSRALRKLKDYMAAELLDILGL